MKYAVIVAAMVLLALFDLGKVQAVQLSGAEWKSFSESNAHYWYYDLRSIEQPGKSITKVWCKSVAKNRASIEEKIRLLKKFGGSTWGYENYLYTLNLFEIDCPKKKHRLVMVKDYDRSENILESAVSQDMSWDSIPPGSIIESLYGIVCSEAQKR
ncbi:MAG: hypothetical protein K8I29_18645 [Alphaproteobacteria bacterium]|uniref:Surface-adhesin protein E-like domain-containing protein n=1 Tax=Candidatus Nitrobium versatile TaxID=2884831 RepID=A0A953M3C7_9BACT|nr:hypothetical protein [Candidatus Nitrobium versatile]